MKFRTLGPRSADSRLALIGLAVLALAGQVGCDSAGSHGDQITLKGAEVRIAGTSHLMATVQDLEVLPNGDVWVLNSAEPLFLAFGSEGNIVQSHGRRGGGPDEFDAPAGFVVGGLEGDAWILDQARHRLISVSNPDSSRRELILPEDELPLRSVVGGMNLLSSLVRTARFGEEVVLPRRAEASGSDIFAYWLSSWSADLVAFHPATGAARLLVPVGTLLGDPRPHVELATGGLPPFPLWFRLWAVCSEDELRVYDRFRNELRGFTRDGTEIGPISLPSPRFTEVTPQQFARAAFDLAVVEGAGAVTPNVTEMSASDSARLIDQLARRLTATPQQIANILPRYVDLRCSDDSSLWIRPLDLETGGLGGGPTWLHIRRDGEVRNLRFPDGFDPYRFTAERAWGVQRDQFDLPSVGWIPIP